MLQGSSALSEFRTSLSKVLTLWHGVKVKQCHLSIVYFCFIFRHWVNSVSDIYGPDEIEELLEDLNRLEMASFDGIMMFDNDPVPPDLMRPTSSEMNIMRDGEAVISGCITQLPDDDLEDFDIDGSHVSSIYTAIRNDFYR